jgi:hypothetical protein
MITYEQIKRFKQARIQERARNMSRKLEEIAEELPGPERVKRYKLERDRSGCMVCEVRTTGHYAAAVPCLRDLDGRVFSHWVHENGKRWYGGVPRVVVVERKDGTVKESKTVPARWPHAAVFVLPEECK